MRKSLFMLLAVALLSVVGCGEDYASKARALVCKHVDYLVNFNDGKKDLYMFLPAASNSLAITKTNVETEVSEQVKISVPGVVETFRTETAIVPSDKGHDNPNPQFVVCGKVSAPRYGEAAVLYDVVKDEQSLVCYGDKIYPSKNMILCAKHDSYGSGYTAVDVYDLTGSKIPYRSFNGSISGNDVVANLVIAENGDVFGNYYYTRFVKNNNPKSFLAIRGKHSKNKLSLACYNGYGSITETWVATMQGDVITGVMILEKNDREFPFTLTEIK